jgi:exo-beta-1,3-glucanase (GH17 family)
MIKRTKNCKKNPKQKIQLTAKDILGNPNYLAISYGGYRKSTRGIQPTVAEIKEDMKILHAMKIKILRTYNVQLAQAETILEAIRELKSENPSFEMYVMLGAWIDCKNAWTNHPVDHQIESDQNESEIARAVSLANKYPSIVKIIAVGNEAMVKWATNYYVQPSVILKWVSYLQDLKKQKKLPKNLWITSSDNFASWGGGSDEYHTEDLNKLIEEVDYISMHTYPMHDTHYNPVFWYTKEEKPNIEKVNNIMLRARDYAASQYDSVANYLKSLGIKKPIHIGETGWASFSNGLYGNKGSKATDEYKEALFYWHMREWTAKAGISCFYFEAFDEVWKDALNPKGSENHFGLFTIDGKAKYALWDLVDEGVFDGLGRNKNSITKTYNGNKDSLLLEVHVPPFKKNNTTL